MIRIVALYGSLSGLIVAIPMLWQWLRLTGQDQHPPGGMLFGYTVMIIALTAVFLGVKRYRDQVLGGAIRFVPAFGVGLAISAVAGLFYVVSWEIVMAYGEFDFAAWYSAELMQQARAQGAEAVQKAMADVESFKRLYSNPLTRMAFTFIEIFPVGVLISAISAAILRNSRVLPARATG
jgi:hypothetical protein